MNRHYEAVSIPSNYMTVKEKILQQIQKLKGTLLRKERLLGVDIGTSSVRVALFNDDGELVKAHCEPLSADCFTGGVIAKPDKVGAVIRDICSKLETKELRAATAVPVSSIFSTKIKVAPVPKKDMRAAITLDAASSIPHPIDAVAVDFQILKVLPDGKWEVLVVAVKNEIIESYQETFMEAGLELALVDIDAHAIEHAVITLPSQDPKATIALVNIGARYSSMNIVAAGQSLVTGDISVGGKHLSEAIMSELKISAEEAEALKKSPHTASADKKELLLGCFKKYTENIASDINRRLTLLWSSAGQEGTIASIILSGAGAQCFGLEAAVEEKTGIKTKLFNPFKEYPVSADVTTSVQEQGSRFGIVCGLAQRSPGDRIYPEGVFR